MKNLKNIPYAMENLKKTFTILQKIGKKIPKHRLCQNLFRHPPYPIYLGGTHVMINLSIPNVNVL